MGVTYVLDGPLEGSCPLVRSGDLVTIGYTASTLTDPHPIDDTYQTGQPLSFRLGDPGQVIKGIEVAVHLLPKGGKGRFIIPSALAFGPAGSSSGIVPPWTPLLYRVEVLDATTVPSNSKADSTAASR